MPSDGAALETALRLLWDCPADLIQKAQSLCQTADALNPAALREAVRGHGILEAWLDRAEEWLPWVRAKKPRQLVEQWEAQYGTSPALERLRNTAVFHEDFDSLWNALVLGQEADLQRAAGKNWASGAVRLMTLHGPRGWNSRRCSWPASPPGRCLWSPRAVRQTWRRSGACSSSG